MKPTDHKNALIHRAALRYTEEQMRMLLCMRDMVKEEVKKGSSDISSDVTKNR